MIRFFVLTTKTRIRLRACAGSFEPRWAYMSDGTFSDVAARVNEIAVIRAAV